jgi:hypothetical protein
MHFCFPLIISHFFPSSISHFYHLHCLWFFTFVSGFPAFPTVLDINQIRDILPHR